MLARAEDRWDNQLKVDTHRVRDKTIKRKSVLVKSNRNFLPLLQGALELKNPIE